MGTHFHQGHYCAECGNSILSNVYANSIVRFKIPLCLTCEQNFSKRFEKTVKEPPTRVIPKSLSSPSDI
jgi:hypothetical protein